MNNQITLPIEIQSVETLIDQYRLFILDQWGVLHNGATLLGRTLEILQMLKVKQKQVAILSNSGKPAEHAVRRMAQIGIPADLYDMMLTSGEHAQYCFKTRDDPFYQALGKNYYIFLWGEQETEVTENIPFNRVHHIKDADFVICAGLETQDLEAFQPRLEAAIAKDLPLICVNSDLVTVTPDGRIMHCPGALAKRYEAMGGKVRWHGKPDLQLYRLIGERFGGLDQALCVGDSLSHDIKGANGAKIDSLLITSGIHYQALGTPISSESVASLANAYDAMPNYFTQYFA